MRGESIHHSAFWVWVTSLSVTFSPSFIHLATNFITSFFFTVGCNSIVCMYHIFIIHLSVRGKLDWFHFLAAVKISLWTVGQEGPSASQIIHTLVFPLGCLPKVDVKTLSLKITTNMSCKIQRQQVRSELEISSPLAGFIVLEDFIQSCCGSGRGRHQWSYPVANATKHKANLPPVQ